MDLGTLVMKIVADASQFEKTMSNTENGVSRLTKIASGAGKVLGGVVVTGATAAATAVSALAVKGVGLASDLAEVQNVVDTVFGEQGSKMIESFSKDAMKNFGLTELQAKQFSSTIGAMGSSMGLSGKQVEEMSTGLTGLTGDMASFYNLDHQTAFEKIRSGISGETEPLKQLGINMSVANLEAFALSEGLETAYNQMTEAEKATLRYNYILSVTSNAQGDFAKTSDGYANQLRLVQGGIENLAIALGSQLLPHLNNFLSFMLDNMPKIQEIAQTVFDSIGFVMNNLWSFIQEYLLPVFMAIYEFVEANFEPMKNTFVRVFGLIQSAIKLVVDIIQIFLVPIFDRMFGQFSRTGEEATAFQGAFDLINGVLNGAITVLETLIGWIQKAVDWYSKLKEAMATGGEQGKFQPEYGGYGSYMQQRAYGGPMSAGKSYLVGEYGPEVITPGKNSYATPVEESKGRNVSNNVQNNIQVIVRNPVDVLKEMELINRRLVEVY